MASIEALKPQALYRRCDTSEFAFTTTAELADIAEVVGQERAVEAIRFGVGIRRDGYNLFALGPPATGKHAVVRQFLEHEAGSAPTPADLCYVNNFEQPHRPRALRLPPGMGVKLRRDMERLVDELRGVIPATFESDEYHSRMQQIEEGLKERQEQAFEELRQEAEKQDIALVHTPGGLAFAPMRKGEVIGPEEFRALSEPEREAAERKVEKFQTSLEAIVRQIPQWRRETQEKIRALNREVTMAAVDHQIGELRGQYAAQPEVLVYLDAIERDVVDNVDDFRRSEEHGPEIVLGLPMPRAAPSLRRYQVNVLVNHDAHPGAPVIYEDNPTYQNLVGRVEHLAQMGALVTDFTLIKPGALHQANGGYLLVDARKVLSQPYAWEGLKRALSSRQIRIESLGQALSLISTVSLEPEPVPLDLKVVLLGERLLYYLLHQYDPDFRELFKVAVDFEDRMDRDPESHHLYARLIGTLARREGLLPLDPGAVARTIEHSARLVGDAEKLSVQIGNMADLLREADYWAAEAGRPAISAPDVQRAIDAAIRRSDRVRRRLQEEIERGTILIDTSGERLGQVNGLSVVELGGYTFGHPNRITARVHLGKGDVVDIEREVELGGPIHSKGVLILAGYLSGRYVPDLPLSLSASLVFEQSYGGVEGDSASSAELYALLSALAERPLKQSLAVTGSVNQYGEVQAIGGVNEKIEGFFDLCRARGLDGTHGVLIPAANVKHLMLRQDVIDAVARGEFRIYPIATVDQGIEILTGLPAGEREASGLFPEGSVNYLVELRLLTLAEQSRAFAAAPGAPEPSS